MTPDDTTILSMISIWAALVLTWLMLLLIMGKIFKFYSRFAILSHEIDNSLNNTVNSLKKVQASLTEINLEQQQTNRILMEMLEVQRGGMIAEIIEEDNQ